LFLVFSFFLFRHNLFMTIKKRVCQEKRKGRVKPPLSLCKAFADLPYEQKFSGYVYTGFGL
jgi:hypothetical protein